MTKDNEYILIVIIIIVILVAIWWAWRKGKLNKWIPTNMGHAPEKKVKFCCQ